MTTPADLLDMVAETLPGHWMQRAYSNEDGTAGCVAWHLDRACQQAVGRQSAPLRWAAGRALDIEFDGIHHTCVNDDPATSEEDIILACKRAAAASRLRDEA